MRSMVSHSISPKRRRMPGAYLWAATLAAFFFFLAEDGIRDIGVTGVQTCALPIFGGQILSHDLVEAALMLRENWEVWFAYDLEGSYEEGPQALIENAQRERRWCQGNLQHSLVLFAKGLRGVSRLHLILGICGYLAGPLWLAFLLTFNWIYWYQKYTQLSDIPVQAFTPFLSNLSGTAHALL